LYILLPYGLLAGAIYVFAAIFAASAISLAIIFRHDLYYPFSWGLIAFGLFLAGIGHGIWYWLDLNDRDPFPSAADFFYLAVYPIFIVALWRLGRQSARDGGAFYDALIVATSAAVLGWAFLITPHIGNPDLTVMQVLISTAYPVADLILLPLILRLVFLQRTRVVAHMLLLLGMLAYLAADILYAHGNLTGWYSPGGLTDALWLVAYALVVGAVWHPSAAIKPTAHTSLAELSRRRLILLGASSILVPAIILLTAGTDVQVVRGAAIASILLFLLVMIRMAGLLQKTQRQANELERLSRIDPLTGAANRRHFWERLSSEMARADRSGEPLALAFVDLDHFKAFNDTHGHSSGDQLLRELVKAWKPQLREIDKLARFGGEEFVILLPNTDTDHGRVVLDRLRGYVPYGQTYSAGLAAYYPGESDDSLIRRADQALYEAKNQGRNRTVVSRR